MADFKELLENPETIEEKRARWFNKLRSWVPQCIWFENLGTQDLTEQVTDVIAQPDFGDVRDISSTNPTNVFSLTSDTTDLIGTGADKDYLGNTFTPPVTFEADSVGFDISNVNSTFGNVRFEIFATSGGGAPFADTSHSQAPNVAFAFTPNPTTQNGQTFTTVAGGSLDSIDLSLRHFSPVTGDIILDIYATAAGVPVGAPIGTSDDFDISALTATLSTHNLPFSTPVALAPATTYAWIIRDGTAPPSGVVDVSRNTVGTYPGGNLYAYDGVTFTSVPGHDFTNWSVNMAGSPGVPTGGPIAVTDEIDVDDLPSSNGTLLMQNLLTPVTLLGSTSYAVVVNQLTANGDIQLALDSTDPYGDGNQVASEDDGTSWAADTANDLLFQVSGFAAGATLTGRTAQQFLADNLGQLQDLSLALHTDVAASTGTIRVEILDDDGGIPGSVVHGFVDIDVTTLPVGPQGSFVGYTLTPVQNLAGNKKYWIVFKNTVLPDATVFAESKPGGGLPEEHRVSFDSGNIWSQDLPAIDIAFQVFTERTANAEAEGINVAVFQGLAVVCAQIECAIIDHVRETYICQANGAYLDEHGIERNVQRTLNELDITYRERIKNITNSTSCPTIKQLVDALLPVGEATILEDFDAGLFFDREEFFNRGAIMIDPIYNAFTIIVDKQIHPPYSFHSREYFIGREDFYGQQDSQIELFEIIVEAVNSAKALGTVYRLVERLG